MQWLVCILAVLRIWEQESLDPLCLFVLVCAANLVTCTRAQLASIYNSYIIPFKYIHAQYMQTVKADCVVTRTRLRDISRVGMGCL